MADETHLDWILESALRAHVAKRCERAYIHECRNTLQSVYVGIDLVARVLSGKAGSVSGDRALQTARRAIQNHEQELARTVEHLAGREEAPRAIAVVAVLREVMSFLSNDAAARGVTIRLIESEEMHLEASPESFRLVLLSTLTDAIDAMSVAGEIEIVARSTADQVTLTFQLVSLSAELLDDNRWRFGDDREPLNASWVRYATRRLVLKERGEIESAMESHRDRDCRVIRLRYHAAKSLPLDLVPLPS